MRLLVYKPYLCIDISTIHQPNREIEVRLAPTERDSEPGHHLVMETQSKMDDVPWYPFSFQGTSMCETFNFE